MDQALIEKIMADGFLKTAEDWEAAGRFAARGYYEEMQKLSQQFSDEETGEEEGEEGELTGEDLAELVQVLGL